MYQLSAFGETCSVLVGQSGVQWKMYTALIVGSYEVAIANVACFAHQSFVWSAGDSLWPRSQWQSDLQADALNFPVEFPTTYLFEECKIESPS